MNLLTQLILSLAGCKIPLPVSSDADLTQNWALLRKGAKEYKDMGQVADQQRDQIAEW